MPSRITFEEFLEFCNSYPRKARDIGEIKGDMLIIHILEDKGKSRQDFFGCAIEDDLDWFLDDLSERYGKNLLMNFNRYFDKVTVAEFFEHIQELINSRPRKMTFDEFLNFCKKYEYFNSRIEKVESTTLVTDLVKYRERFFWVIRIEFEVSFANFDFKRDKTTIAELFEYIQEFRKDKPRKMIFEEFLNFCENSELLQSGIKKVKGDDLVLDLFDEDICVPSILFWYIEIEFGVSFKNFDYGKYFSNTLFDLLIFFFTLGYLFGLLGFFRKRVRKFFRSKEQITIAGLFDYMQKNIVEV